MILCGGKEEASPAQPMRYGAVLTWGGSFAVSTLSLHSCGTTLHRDSNAFLSSSRRMRSNSLCRSR
jgi:hypothetical protein